MSLLTRRSLTAAKQLTAKLNIRPSILKMRSLSTVNDDYQYYVNPLQRQNSVFQYDVKTATPDKDPIKPQQVFIKI
jgi:hypothetical protein